MTQPIQIGYKASPTAMEMHNSHADVRGVMGCVGSGKSTMMIIELIMMALLQKPDKYGKRSSHWLVVRETYPQLLQTVYASFKLWLKPNGTTVRYTESAPMKIRWTDKLPDGTELNVLFTFMAVAKPSDYENLKSLELTGAFINECGAMDYEVVSTVLSRLGRYPAPVDAVDEDDPITRVSLLLDTNPPDEDSWFAEKMRVTPKGWALWKQPPALLKDDSAEDGYVLNPEGENFKYLGVGPVAYYLNKVHSMTYEQIKVLFCGEFGVTLDGKAIYRRQWSDDLHVSKANLGLIPGQRVLLGWDWGKGGEACTVAQETPSGQLRVIKEFYGENIGLEDFARNFVKPWLEKNCPKDETVSNGKVKKPAWVIESIGDPAGVASHGLAKHGLNYFDVLNNSKDGVFKGWFTTHPARTNHTELRLNAVRFFLTGDTIGGAPLFQLNRDCKLLRKGFNSYYCYERKQVSGKAQYKDVPTKNEASHVHDSLQYIALHVHPKYDSLVKHTEFVTRQSVRSDNVTNY